MTMETGDKIAMVTGAGSGIGRATALALLDEGFSVVLTGRRREALEQTAALARPGTRSLVVPADISDAASVSALFDATKAAFGHLDLLFNNAGRGAPAVSLEDLPFDQSPRNQVSMIPHSNWSEASLTDCASICLK